ncbi:MAG: formate dehydrogenase subunit delta [Verrucomicrobia bacterium]|nr:formate dehydrogenase subunit delta [Verrucomicrobiota bacterium]
MDSNKLVKMANDIAAFFEAEPDPAACSAGIGGHIGRFWDPRMRRALFRHLDEHGGEGLRDSVVRALSAHREALLTKG